jgi:hypothetical protein
VGVGTTTGEATAAEATGGGAGAWGGLAAYPFASCGFCS